MSNETDPDSPLTDTTRLPVASKLITPVLESYAISPVALIALLALASVNHLFVGEPSS